MPDLPTMPTLPTLCNYGKTRLTKLHEKIKYQICKKNESHTFDAEEVFIQDVFIPISCKFCLNTFIVSALVQYFRSERLGKESESKIYKFSSF